MVEWKRRSLRQVLLGLVLLVLLPGLATGGSSQQTEPEANCYPTNGIVVVPTGTDDPWMYPFTPTFHGTYLFYIERVPTKAFFELESKASTITVPILGQKFATFDFVVEFPNGNSYVEKRDSGEIPTDAEGFYVFMPYGPDPLLVEDGHIEGGGFQFRQCT